jgi:Mechanosensitive ion channel
LRLARRLVDLLLILGGLVVALRLFRANALRSTRIRTSDRTVVSVPNGQIANMTLENLSSRDKFWFHPILPLRYGTTSPQMRAVLDGIRGVLEKCRHVELESVRVHFLCFGSSSLDVEALAYILARDKSHFLEISRNAALAYHGMYRIDWGSALTSNAYCLGGCFHLR